MSAVTRPAWECRDQTHQAEIYYNQPLRAKNRRLEDENLALKRLLRENAISWQAQIKSPVPLNPVHEPEPKPRTLPRLPVEIQLRILSDALTSPHTIVDPLCKLRRECLTAQEKAEPHYLAIHFLATCKAYYVEGTNALWFNNRFTFTTPEALKNFAELDYAHRKHIRRVTFRLIAQFYDDHHRVRRLPPSYHLAFSVRKPPKLKVHKRPKDNIRVWGGFRAYAWYQLVDFLDAMLPPFDPSSSTAPSTKRSSPLARPRLLPSLESLRIDFVNFGNDLFDDPPDQLHDLACHELGSTLNELVLTGIPQDDCGIDARNYLVGLLREEGLLIEDGAMFLAQKNGIRRLGRLGHPKEPSYNVIRAMRGMSESFGINNYDYKYPADVSPPAAPGEGGPHESRYESCRTIWKKIPVYYGDLFSKSKEPEEEKEFRMWELFDRVTGKPLLDKSDKFEFYKVDSEDSDKEGLCENCGLEHYAPLNVEDIYVALMESTIPDL
ncbi:hypothetical protein F5X96DRAFT_662771 [Biscogniauxia mediterranea]|nr:hypothetical protein F5X96DRAFT_662771 [Biscogniauxia mediterranea]